MDALTISRWQFAVTTSFHFLFAALSVGLSIFIATIETRYVQTKDETFLRMAKFWGNLFLVSVGMGAVTGMVLEFQFGLNWSQFSRHVGDIFGPPLAIESWVAFFLEAVFIGVWIFGWRRISPKLHLFAIWMVALGTTLSAYWIISANAFMQEPVGYTVRNNRIELTDFFALINSPQVQVQFWHTLFACTCTSSFFAIGIAAYHLLKKSPEIEIFKRSLHLAALFGMVSILGVFLSGHFMARHIVHAQPMKLAAAEALWETASPAGEVLFAILDEENQRNRFAIEIPMLLSFFAYDKFAGEVKGMIPIQAEFVAKYGPDDYIPPVGLCFWSFRIMILSGILMIVVLTYLLLSTWKKRYDFAPGFLKFLIWCIPLPYLANTTGWIVTEVGRQPWVVYGIMKTRDGLTTNLSLGYALGAFILFTLIYSVLSFIAISVMARLVAAGAVKLENAKGGY